MGALDIVRIKGLFDLAGNFNLPFSFLEEVGMRRGLYLLELEGLVIEGKFSELTTPADLLCRHPGSYIVPSNYRDSIESYSVDFVTIVPLSTENWKITITWYKPLVQELKNTLSMMYPILGGKYLERKN